MVASPVQSLDGSISKQPFFELLLQSRTIPSLLLMLLPLLLYNPVVHNSFVNYDDLGYITGNKHVQAGLTGDTIRWAFTSQELANWHPLTWLSHALDSQLFHLNPIGHHYTNVFLHGLAGVLLFLFLQMATGFTSRSFVVAALFAVHPINVESVAWASERKNVLCTVFFFAGLLAYRWYVDHPTLGRYVSVAISFSLALMSKPLAVTFPCVLLLLDYWPLNRTTLLPGSRSESKSSAYQSLPFSRLVLEKLPLFALSAASAVITMIAQKGGGALRDEYGFSARVANATVAYTRYLGKAIWPSHLAALYPFPRTGLPSWEVLLSGLLLIAITVGCIALKQYKYLAVGWFWFLGTMVPMIGLVQVGEQALADRYAYIPFIGLFLAVIWAIADWSASKRIGHTLETVAVIAALAGFCVVTTVQVSYWHDTTSLWSHALAVTNNNFVAHDNLGAELIKYGKVPEARDQFLAAIAINPRDAFSQINVGVCEKKLGNTNGAIEHYNAALRLAKDPMLRATALSNLGSLYRMNGDYSAAREHYIAALALKPESATAIFGLGLVAQRAGNFSEAAGYYAKAVGSEPSDVGYLLLAQALEKSGRTQEATKATQLAQQLSPNLGSAQQAVHDLLQN